MAENIGEWERNKSLKHQVGSRDFAPIVLFVYNRVDHVKQTVEALKKNKYAEQSEVFIYSDAGKNDESAERVEEVRDFVKTINGFKNITLIERDENWGLARNIIDGVTQIVKQYGKVIVLEDDLITSPYFLQYMNEALNFYQDKKRVMHINGYVYPMDTNDLSETFFLRLPLPWGWATWDDRWMFYERDVDKIYSQFSNDDIYQFNFEGTNPGFWKQVEMNKNKQLHTWFIFWYASIFKKKGIALYPQSALVQNIGFDGTGVHCGITKNFDVILQHYSILGFEEVLNESEKAFEKFRKYFDSINPSFLKRYLLKIYSILKRL